MGEVPGLSAAGFWLELLLTGLLGLGLPLCLGENLAGDHVVCLGAPGKAFLLAG